MAKNNLKAFVRYDANKRIIPGSTIFRKKKPNGNFIETNADLCCPTVDCVATTLTFTGDTVFACPARTLTLTLDNLPAVYDSIVWTIYSEDGPTITSGQGTAELVVSVPAVTGFSFTASVIVYDANGGVIGAGSSIGAVVDCP